MVSQSNGGNFNLDYITNGDSTWTDQRLQVDFNVNNINAWAPQFWLRKTTATGDAGGYLITLSGNYPGVVDPGEWTLILYPANAGGNWGLSNVAVTASSPAISASTWYTAVAQVINNGSSNPVISFYVYPQGGTMPAQPTLTLY